VNIYGTREEMATAMADAAMENYVKAVEERGRFVVAISCGQELELLAEKLTAEPYVSFVDWKKWFLFLVDDVCVDLTHERSSYRRINDIFLEYVRIPELQVFPAFNSDISADDMGNVCELAAVDYEHRMRDCLGEDEMIPVIDLVVLSSDEHGNVASFVKDHAILKNQVRNYQPTWGATGQHKELSRNQIVAPLYDCEVGEERGLSERMKHKLSQKVSMTLSLINNATEIFLALTGPASAPLLKDYFGTFHDKSLPINMIGTKTSPKMFVDQDSMKDVELAHLLKSFQVQDYSYLMSIKLEEMKNDKSEFEHVEDYPLPANILRRREKPKMERAPSESEVKAVDQEFTLKSVDRKISEVLSLRDSDDLLHDVEALDEDDEDDQMLERAMMEEELLEEETDSPGYDVLIVPDDCDLSTAVRTVQNTKKRILLRSGVYSWEGFITISGNLQVAGAYSCGKNSDEKTVLSGMWKFEDGASCLFQRLTLTHANFDAIIQIDNKTGSTFDFINCNFENDSGACLRISGDCVSNFKKCTLGTSFLDFRIPVTSCLHLYDHTKVNMEGCRIQGCLNCLVMFDNSEASLSHCEFTENNVFALSMKSSSKVSMTSCSILMHSGGEHAKTNNSTFAIFWIGKNNDVQIILRYSMFACRKVDLWASSTAPCRFLDDVNNFKM